MVRNTPTGCGNNLPILLRSVFFAKIEKCKLFCFGPIFDFFRNLGTREMCVFIDFHRFSTIPFDFLRFSSNLTDFRRFSSIIPLIRQSGASNMLSKVCQASTGILFLPNLAFLVFLTHQSPENKTIDQISISKVYAGLLVSSRLARCPASAKIVWRNVFAMHGVDMTSLVNCIWLSMLTEHLSGSSVPVQQNHKFSYPLNIHPPL